MIEALLCLIRLTFGHNCFKTLVTKPFQAPGCLVGCRYYTQIVLWHCRDRQEVDRMITDQSRRHYCGVPNSPPHPPSTMGCGGDQILNSRSLYSMNYILITAWFLLYFYYNFQMLHVYSQRVIRCIRASLTRTYALFQGVYWTWWCVFQLNH